MHPGYTSDRPGECPICGMNLEPIPAMAAGGDTAGRGDVPGLATVELGPERIQMIGVRTAVVARAALADDLELAAFVAPDESRLHRVQLRVSGWVQDLRVSRTGERVRAGQPLLTLYSPELYQSEQEFLIETGAAADPSQAAHDAPAAAHRRLELLGVPAGEIARLERERRASANLAILSPVSGTVLERGVAEGQYVGADTPLFTISDLSRVWVLADVYEMDLPRIGTGARAEFVTDGLPGRRFEGTVEFVYPTVSAETRTVRARIALDNRGGLLRPGMYGRVLARSAGAATLVAPSEAVVDAGREHYVFLARAGGRFEPRRVTVGIEQGDRIQILAGLAAGDTVVASASFLIDSESRLKAAIAGMGSQPGGAPPAPAPRHAGH
jgi:Cu(I)/Ag(I) efflux system membrane fusion protein